jgi:hypothetical protein
MMSQGRVGGRFEPPNLLLFGRGNPSLIPRSSRLPTGKGSSLAMSLRSLDKGDGPSSPN